MRTIKNLTWSRYNDSWTAVHRDEVRGSVRLHATDDGHYYGADARTERGYEGVGHFQTLQEAKDAVFVATATPKAGE